ncbi:MAG: TonB family protein [Betaproteobacteria bacterium]|nr:TonB family protein [Betaproteobacteria bacterium]
MIGSFFASLVVHAILLSVHFSIPDRLRFDRPNSTLEVALVNARTRERPVNAELLAQANLDRGGDTDEARRAMTPLPVTPPKVRGKDLIEARRRVDHLEKQQDRLLTATNQARSVQVSPDTRPDAPAAQRAPQQTGRELSDLSLAAMRLEAEINRRYQEYQKRPRKKFIGARAAEYRFAQYEEDWRMKIERVGTINYPAQARGKLYGNLRLTVTIRPDGRVDSMELDRSSGLKLLDAAAFRIVRMAAPFAPFPSDIRRDTDLIVITRTWFFGQGDTLWTE